MAPKSRAFDRSRRAARTEVVDNEFGEVGEEVVALVDVVCAHRHRNLTLSRQHKREAGQTGLSSARKRLAKEQRKVSAPERWQKCACCRICCRTPAMRTIKTIEVSGPERSTTIRECTGQERTNRDTRMQNAGPPVRVRARR